MIIGGSRTPMALGVPPHLYHQPRMVRPTRDKRLIPVPRRHPGDWPVPPQSVVETGSPAGAASIAHPLRRGGSVHPTDRSTAVHLQITGGAPLRVSVHVANRQVGVKPTGDPIPIGRPLGDGPPRVDGGPQPSDDQAFHGYGQMIGGGMPIGRARSRWHDIQRAATGDEHLVGPSTGGIVICRAHGHRMQSAGLQHLPNIRSATTCNELGEHQNVWAQIQHGCQASC